MENQESTIPENSENAVGYKNPPIKGRFKPGQSGNPGGRPKGSLKSYDRAKFAAMTDKEKEEWLKKVPPELRYRMAEGNPDTTGTIEHTIPQNLIDLIKSAQRTD